LPSEAIIIMPTQDGQPIEVAPKIEKGWIDIQEFVTGGTCRRVILDQVMDGRVDREQCEEGEEACDMCRAKEEEARRQEARERVINMLNDGFDDSGVVMESGVDDSNSDVSIDRGFQHEQEGRPRTSIAEEFEFEAQERERQWVGVQVARQRRQEGVEVRELREQLEEWSGICPSCHSHGQRHGIEHAIEDCGFEDAAEVYRVSRSMQKEIKQKRLFGRFGCCMWCGVPQAICQKWKQKEDVGWWEEVPGGRCQYEGVIIPAIVAILVRGEDGDERVFRLLEENGVDIRDQTSVCRWFGERVEWGRMEATRMVQVFHLLAGLSGQDLPQTG
jgi:hypothetical protein